MEEKQQKNRYDIKFYRSITEKAKEMGLFEKSAITSGEILGIIASLVGEDYRPKSGNYILNKWGETMKATLQRERKTVYSQEKERKVSTIVFVPIKEGTVGPLRSNEDKKLLLRNVINVLDKQGAARNNEIYVPNLREMWVGDEATSGIALLCKASKILRATFGFGFTYDYRKMKKVVRIQDASRLRERLVALIPNSPKEKEEEKGDEEFEVKLNQFVRLTDIAQDAMYIMAAVLYKEQRGIEIYSLTKFINEAPSLVSKNLSVTDLKVLIKTVGKEYFTINGGSNIVSLTVGGWEKVQKKYDPKERLIEVLILTKEELENTTVLNEEIGLCSFLTDCSWESFKKLGRLVYTGKIKLPADKKLEEKLMKDVENDLIQIQMLTNPLA